jgi:MFS family permease
MFGSFFAGSIVKIGLKNSAILANVIGIIGCLPQISDNIWALICGKLILGFAGGLMIVTSSIYIAETLPNSAVSTCGTSVNLGIVGGIMLISIVQSLALPFPLSPDYSTSTSWKFCFTFPIITAFIDILMWQFLIKEDAIEKLLD